MVARLVGLTGVGRTGAGLVDVGPVDAGLIGLGPAGPVLIGPGATGVEPTEPVPTEAGPTEVGPTGLGPGRAGGPGCVVAVVAGVLVEAVEVLVGEDGVEPLTFVAGVLFIPDAPEEADTALDATGVGP